MTRFHVITERIDGVSVASGVNGSGESAYEAEYEKLRRCDAITAKYRLKLIVRQRTFLRKIRSCCRCGYISA
ncbi:MAG TPA: hypothetical protein PKK43_13440 [Spirochaetota bacterium]|nr:hypothetical protein [Spirochaetota bacterium]